MTANPLLSPNGPTSISSDPKYINLILAINGIIIYIISMESEETNLTSAEFIRIHFYSKTLPHLSADQQAEYNQLRGRLFDEIEPHNALEYEFFEQLVHASWQLDRARSLEDSALFQLTTDPNNKQFSKNLALFQRLRNSLERTQNVTIRELRRLIATRVLAVAINCTTLLTTETDAKVPALLDLRQTLPASETRPQRNVLSMSLARLKNPLAGYTPPEEAIERLKANAA